MAVEGESDENLRLERVGKEHENRDVMLMLTRVLCKEHEKANQTERTRAYILGTMVLFGLISLPKLPVGLELTDEQVAYIKEKMLDNQRHSEEITEGVRRALCKYLTEHYLMPVPDKATG